MSRKILDKNFCVIPWTGVEIEPSGEVKNCVISKEIIGNIHKDSIEKIISSNPIRQKMLEGEYPKNCEGCYLQEKHRPNNFDSISSRIYYAKELANKIPKNFKHLIDINQKTDLSSSIWLHRTLNRLENCVENKIKEQAR